MSFGKRLWKKLLRYLGASQRRVNPIVRAHTQPVALTNTSLLKGKNVLITGAGRNIGRSIAIEMAKQGASIFFTDLVEERCKNLEQELSHEDVSSQWFVSDVSKRNDTDRLFESLVESGVGIDVLVNNVGVQFLSEREKKLDPDEWQKTFQTNVFGPLYLTKLISGMMIRGKIRGTILFVTSVHEEIIFGWPSYSSSKAALGMIVKELALEWSEHGIRVNGIAPGLVAESEDGDNLPFRYAPLHNSSIPPNFIGRAAVYLASDYFSEFTTGTVLKVDDGLSLLSYRRQRP